MFYNPTGLTPGQIKLAVLLRRIGTEIGLLPDIKEHTETSEGWRHLVGYLGENLTRTAVPKEVLDYGQEARELLSNHTMSAEHIQQLAPYLEFVPKVSLWISAFAMEMHFDRRATITYVTALESKTYDYTRKGEDSDAVHRLVHDDRGDLRSFYAGCLERGDVEGVVVSALWANIPTYLIAGMGFIYSKLPSGDPQIERWFKDRIESEEEVG